MSAFQKQGTVGVLNVTATRPNELLKLDDMLLPMNALEALSTQKYTYQVKLLRIVTKDGSESRIRLVNATWFVDGTRKFSESTMNVQVICNLIVR